MIPLFFGPAKRRKYGVLHPAIGHGNKGRGIVVCDALFDEAVCAHRTLRFAADSLAEARCTSLRFDYYGTGDSAGETEDFSIEQSKTDIIDAIKELKISTRIPSVFLFGLRLGATLAMQIASLRDDVRGVILWDPIINGTSVLDLYSGALSSDAGSENVEGFRLPTQAAYELQNVSIRALLETYGKPALIVCTSPTDEHRQLANTNRHITLQEFDAPEAWSNTPLGGMRPIPASVVRAILDWESRQ